MRESAVFPFPALKSCDVTTVSRFGDVSHKERILSSVKRVFSGSSNTPKFLEFYLIFSLHPTEDMKIRKEITVNYEELLALGEEFVTDVQPHQTVRYLVLYKLPKIVLGRKASCFYSFIFLSPLNSFFILEQIGILGCCDGNESFRFPYNRE